MNSNKKFLLTIIVLTSLFSGCIAAPDSDGDGYADEVDDFPEDDRYHIDTDGDGYADKVDSFPEDNRYHIDTDRDGYADEVDDFPEDNRYHIDTDGDGYADEVDDFPENYKYQKYLDELIDIGDALVVKDKNGLIQYCNIEYKDVNSLSGPSVVYVYADCESASESKANSLVKTVANELDVKSQYDSVVVHITDSHTDDKYYSELKITDFSSTQPQSSTSSTPQTKFYNVRYEGQSSGYGASLYYAYADCEYASESKANRLARWVVSNSNEAGKYDAVVVYLTDMHTGKDYYGEYLITNYYS